VVMVSVLGFGLVSLSLGRGDSGEAAVACKTHRKESLQQDPVARWV
jgi:hypothetical protein